jgi:hypothetical protein
MLTLDVLDRARVLTGKAMVVLRLPVSLQIVLRALIKGVARPSSRTLGIRPGRLSSSEARRVENGRREAERFPPGTAPDKARVRE